MSSTSSRPVSRICRVFASQAYHSPDACQQPPSRPTADFVVVELGGPAMRQSVRCIANATSIASLPPKVCLKLCQIHGYCLQPESGQRPDG
uniref:Uncharacterized protein n=1 Tax=Macrostomum lignano TaxID=282301 RepID=A0A1I8FEB4_9PLAT